MTATTAPAGTVPPGPAAPVDMARMRADPLSFVTWMNRRYGDITSHLGDGERVFMLHRPDLVRHVLKDNVGNYTKAHTPDDAMLRPLLGNGLLTSNGEEWARQRRLCAPAFRRTAVSTFDGIITEETEALLERWRPAMREGGALPVEHHLTSLTLAILTRAVLGVDLGAAGEGFGRSVDAVNRFMGHYVPDPDPDPQDTALRRRGYVQARNFLQLIARTVIASRRAAGIGQPPSHDTGSLLDAMIGELDDEALRDQVLTLVMAGHETTAKALTWTLYLLDRHPEEADRVRAEIDEVLGDRTPTAADLPSLVHCRHAIEEAMRLYPPVWLISRRATGPDSIGGYDIPAGALVCVSQWVLHRHPDHWERPDAYVPARFADASPPNHLYLPFGGGERTCIGRHLALVEATLVLAVLMRSARLELEPGFPVEPEALVTLRPKHGMRMTARPR
ncbi:Cytochrome P450 [Streptomyces sp. 1222.5]|uniref:cytochrome P450 n=1 Tax=unclassified Streptomyces TaxID=2593676 RepID=UPI0008988798|nr:MULTISPECIES: cytochrome P450 [unclassified Streptomyces]PKW09358.1 cytochrome P450 [Streptomyces sp. 5112.2]SEC37396.1 Cytochrome P450 [Streptomyces sp. 1222.5]SED53723.1 Cytochrome P450 [Streptomyces sp. 2231.1]